MRYEGFTFKEGLLRLSDYVKIREEYFGGIVFHTNTGDTLEVDQGAYKLLQWLRETSAADIRVLSRQKQIRAILPELLYMNIIEYMPGLPDASDYSLGTGKKSGRERSERHLRSKCTKMSAEKPLPDFSNPHYRTEKKLSAPETVHLAVTYRCGQACPDCYAQRHISSVNHELDTGKMCGIIDDIADNNVFQLAIGGGEPFARPDLRDIVSHAARKGLVIHITTGQYTLKPQWDDVLKHIKTLHIGIRSEELINDTVNVLEKLRVLLEYACDAGLSVGANLIMTRFTLRNIKKLMDLLLECGFKRFIFLRYKPIADHVRWSNENPNAEELNLFKDWLTRAKRQYPNIMFRIDCASAFLMRDMNPLTAIRAGVRGCSAGERIISVAPDGSVYPCSQLVGHAYNAGNLASSSFKKIWERGVLNRYRQFRQNAYFLNSMCGQCNAMSFCGGCRVFAKDAIGSESFCPIKM